MTARATRPVRPAKWRPGTTPRDARDAASRLAAAEADALLRVLWHFGRAHRAEAAGDRAAVIAAAGRAMAEDTARARFTAALRRLSGGGEP